MRARTKRLPGEPGTKQLLHEYGDRLVCVRYRYDAEKKRRYKTVELIIDAGPWEPRARKPPPLSVVYLRLLRWDPQLATEMGPLGAKWHPEHRLWSLAYIHAERLGLLAFSAPPPD